MGVLGEGGGVPEPQAIRIERQSERRRTARPQVTESGYFDRLLVVVVALGFVGVLGLLVPALEGALLDAARIAHRLDRFRGLGHLALGIDLVAPGHAAQVRVVGLVEGERGRLDLEGLAGIARQADAVLERRIADVGVALAMADLAPAGDLLAIVSDLVVGVLVAGEAIDRPARFAILGFGGAWLLVREQ